MSIVIEEKMQDKKLVEIDIQQSPFGSLAFARADGKLLIGSARESISTLIQTGRKRVPEALLNDARFEVKTGCFVTLKADDSEKSLRGCIGFHEPVYKLSWALAHAAAAAAAEDPRFHPVTLSEMERILVEVSVLTPPTMITTTTPQEILKHVRVGVDGLILRWSFGSGLLLPQVATEYGWEAEEFLCNLSMKAGAPPDQWLIPGSQVYKFQAHIFSESGPNGSVEYLPGGRKSETH